MQCRQCGIEIADKALICYRCGTATTEAKFKPVKIRERRAWTPMLAGAAALASALAAVLYTAC